ncbi:hypothetical protein BJV74DRAFT_891010 [Russula compacta]|nr:hypothetical protein BJV74DRAFT_891010 [Russula compacta]
MMNDSSTTSYYHNHNNHNNVFHLHHSNNNNITNNSCPSLLFTSSSEYNTSAASLSSLDNALPQLAIKSGPMITDVTREAAKDATEVASDNEHYQSLKATLRMFKMKKKLPLSPSATSDIIATWDLHIINMEDNNGATALGSLATLSAAKQICSTPITSTDSLPSLTSEPPTYDSDNSLPGEGWQYCKDEDFFIPCGKGLRQANYIFYNLKDRKAPLISSSLGRGHPSHTCLLRPRPAPYHIPILTVNQAHLFDKEEPFFTWVNQATINLGDSSLLAGLKAYQGWEKEVNITKEKIKLLEEKLKEQEGNSRECL